MVLPHYDVLGSKTSSLSLIVFGSVRDVDAGVVSVFFVFLEKKCLSLAITVYFINCTYT